VSQINLQKKEFWTEYGLDHVIFGNIDGKALEVFHKIMDGNAEEIISLGSVKSVNDISIIRKP